MSYIKLHEDESLFEDVSPDAPTPCANCGKAIEPVDAAILIYFDGQGQEGETWLCGRRCARNHQTEDI